MTAGINSAASLREGSASLDVPLGTSIAVHLDGSWRKTDDLDIAGKLLSPNLRAGIAVMRGI